MARRRGEQNRDRILGYPHTGPNPTTSKPNAPRNAVMPVNDRPVFRTHPRKNRREMRTVLWASAANRSGQKTLDAAMWPCALQVRVTAFPAPTAPARID